MTSSTDLERTLPSLQDRFAISVVHLTEYHGLGILIQKDLENGRRGAVLISKSPMQGNATIM